MIPFASQRALGQDLATHLLNAQDNEQIELAHVRGSIARDLHGAFAEWELQAETLTNCRNYLYSLSINPDPAQNRLSREQYLDYIERIEKALGLEGQPRALVFHIKHDREHAHVVWSRIDAMQGKAVHLAFDHEKLMRVTRQFARDHGIELPDGYFKDREDLEKSGQLSLYEKHQQETTGLTKEQRVELVTELWRKSDSAKAFVQALGSHGYMLATGNRPYVLVDIYGDVNALPKLINDKQVRTKDVRAFLERDFPPESLPSIEEAKKLAADDRKSMEAFEKARADEQKADEVQAREAVRRKEVLEKLRATKRRQLAEKRKFEAAQKKERMELKRQHLAQAKRIRELRAKAKIGGLAAFLGRVTGMDKMIHKVRRLNDKRRFDKYKAAREKLAERQARAMAVLRERHRMQFADVKRQVRSVDKVEKRERRSRDVRRLKEARLKDRARKGVEHMQAIDMKRYDALRKPVPEKERELQTDRKKQRGRSLDDWRGGRTRLSQVFAEAADEFGQSRKGEGDGKSRDQELKRREEAARKRRRDRDHDR
ncbi:hypothetical protein TH25_21140 [Thalassospira profundimaris]|uniref:MobA/VirD2-like nuclease domain-containing protein n=1 Tax=Thalassospira profundimaris TaxID=502049 RepID=A0A367WR30_9PROT|nr:relaxase/mobilization nuclease domain-containing protein [Thalassospira profundimaris]RCK43659.1 hypothetical protein TH25_21140 [Thalassospira profundimaris]